MHMYCRKPVLCAPKYQNDSDVCLAPVANLTGSIWWADPYLLITPLSKERGHLVTYVCGWPLCLMKYTAYGCKLWWHPRNGLLSVYAMKSTFSFLETKPQIKNFSHKACQNGVLDTYLQWSAMLPTLEKCIKCLYISKTFLYVCECECVCVCVLCIHTQRWYVCIHIYIDTHISIRNVETHKHTFTLTFLW